MKTITVYPQDIIPNAKYMCDANGQCDLLGQILINGFGIRIPNKTRTPQCLQSGIVHFVVCVRQYVYCNTPLTLALLKLSSLPPRKQVEEANKLLQPLGIVLTTEDKVEQARTMQETVIEVDCEYKLDLTNLFRTSRLRCTCGGSQILPNLDYDIAENTLIACCNYCGDEIPPEMLDSIQANFNDDLQQQLKEEGLL